MPTDDNIARSLQEARERELAVFFSGKYCPRGHVSDRRTSNSECVECRREKAAARRKMKARKRKAVVVAVKKALALAPKDDHVAIAARLFRLGVERAENGKKPLSLIRVAKLVQELGFEPPGARALMSLRKAHVAGHEFHVEL